MEDGCFLYKIEDDNRQLKDLNKQYFNNIIELEYKKGKLEFLCIFEFIIIVLLLMVIII